jgi:hypothetical protein
VAGGRATWQLGEHQVAWQPAAGHIMSHDDDTVLRDTTISNMQRDQLQHGTPLAWRFRYALTESIRSDKKNRVKKKQNTDININTIDKTQTQRPIWAHDTDTPADSKIIRVNFTFFISMSTWRIYCLQCSW